MNTSDPTGPHDRLDRLDQGLEEISHASFTAELLRDLGGDMAPDLARRAEAVDTHLRKAVRTLLFTGTYNDLPLRHRDHPELQARLRRILPEMDQAIFGVTAAAAAHSPTELRQLRALLKSRPELGRQIAERMAALADNAGVSTHQQQQLSTALERACWQLQRLPTQTLIDDAVHRVAKIAARHGQSAELERYLADAAVATTPPPDPTAEPRSRRTPTQRPIRAAGLLGALGLSALSGALAWSFGVTAAAVTAVFASVFVTVFVLVHLPRLRPYLTPTTPALASASQPAGVAAMSMTAQPEDPPGRDAQAPPGPQPPAPWSDEQMRRDHRPGQGLLRSGGWLMGIGAGTAGTGGILFAVGDASNAMGTVTLGALLLALGAVILLLGLIFYGTGHFQRWAAKDELGRED